MDRLILLYEQMKKLRETGVRMKDISEETNIASSVLSSLYSSVLPVYVNLRSNGEDPEKSLDQALQQVNNVSKRKLLGCLDALYEKVCHIDARFVNTKNNGRPFLDDIEKEAVKYLPNAGVYTGLYLAYSSSSFSDGLKVEPYMIASITDGDTMPKVYSQSMSGEYYTGVGLFSPFQIGYLMFNEQKRLQLALKVVYLFIRQGDEIPLEEFANMRTEVIPKALLNNELIDYYNYTCEEGDVIKSMMLVSPEKDLNDLKREKELLKLF